MQMRDKVKQFLAPDWRKNILFIVLFLFIFPLMDVIFLPRYISRESMGFPFTYYLYHVTMPSETAVFSFLPFILDILICYIVSCFIINRALRYKTRSSLDYITLGLVVITIAWIFVKYAIGSFWVIA